MTEEEKKAIADAAALEAEKANGNTTGDESEEKPEEKVDYEVLLKEEKERREKAENVLADIRFKEAEARRKKEEAGDEEEKEEKPLTESRLKEILHSERQTTEKTLQETTALTIARANTSSEAEAQLAVLRWKDIRSSGNLESDVLFAIGGINSKKIIAQNAELKRALQNKGNVNKDITGDYRNETVAGEPKLSQDDAKTYRQAGFIWDNAKRCYKKQLKGSKAFLYKDPKSKRTWAE